MKFSEYWYRGRDAAGFKFDLFCADFALSIEQQQVGVWYKQIEFLMQIYDTNAASLMMDLIHL